MSPLVAGGLALAADPSPGPTEGTLRPDLETWEVSPGLVGFLVTFALALACVLLFLNMSKHLRKVGHNARVQGLPIREPEGIGFQRTDGTPEFGSKESSESSESPDAAAGPDAAGPDAAGSGSAGPGPAPRPGDGPADSERGVSGG